MIDAAQLTTDLKRLVLTIENDLRARVDGPDRDLRQEGAEQAWRDEYDRAREAGRTARTWTEWRDDRVTQAAVAWVLTSVFVRFCEDNRLLEPVWISGPKERRQEAHDARTAYFQQHPLHTDREWLLQPIEHLRSVPATRDLVESHSALWTVAPSAKAAESILAFWHDQDAEGELRRDFTDPELSTRFLGDLYQDLSEHAKDTYALLQTPEFVEEFILDRTLEPALKERPLEGFKLIDPTCGSGHFLLGAFRRLFDKWQDLEPSTDRSELARRALESVCGVDLNPYAVAIARFRLVMAALDACGERFLGNAPGWQLPLATGDSLLHGMRQQGFSLEAQAFAYATEDLHMLNSILQPHGFDAVVGNPPYIYPPDGVSAENYRRLYSSTSGVCAMSVPFTQRFFELAKLPTPDSPAGRVGQITSNSFCRREYGKRLIESFLPSQDLREVIDCEGVWMAGHNMDGTPTLIWFGSPGPGPALSSSVKFIIGTGYRETRAVGDRGEGPVWQSILKAVDSSSFANSYVLMRNIPRDELRRHPWRHANATVSSLLSVLEKAHSHPLSKWTGPLGYTGQTNCDDAFIWPGHMLSRMSSGDTYVREFVTGADVRDFAIDPSALAIFPYDEAGDLRSSPPSGRLGELLWPLRAVLENRVTFDGRTYKQAGRAWWSWHQMSKKRLHGPAIAFPMTASGNHLAAVETPRLHNRHAYLGTFRMFEGRRAVASVAESLASSATGFWLKNSCQPKGGAAALEWTRTYEFNAKSMERAPVVENAHGRYHEQLNLLAQLRRDLWDRAFDPSAVPTRDSLARLKNEWDQVTNEMRSLQEELDWAIYRAFGLTEVDGLVMPLQEAPPVLGGERAFEIALAREVVANGGSSEWFTHPEQPALPLVEIPQRWPERYRAIVESRMKLIEKDPFIALLEQPEYKRRWAAEPWEQRVEKALRGWLLDRLEDWRFWFDSAGRPRTMSVSVLADEVARHEDLRSTLALWAGQRDIDVATALEKLLDTEHVPYLAAWRLKDSALRKRREWERTWDLQRAEDRGEKVGDVPVPPKYTSADFRKPSYWSHRGKLDVPKERFISYPGGNRETDRSTLLGWAGWDHAQQSLALATIINARTAEGVSDERLTPLVAGMAELEPWVDQWHDEADANGINLAEFLRATLDDHLHRLSLTRAQLLDWAPPASPRGRRKKAT